MGNKRDRGKAVRLVILKDIKLVESVRSKFTSDCISSQKILKQNQTDGINPI